MGEFTPPDFPAEGLAVDFLSKYGSPILVFSASCGSKTTTDSPAITVADETPYLRLNPFVQQLGTCVPMAIENRGKTNYQLLNVSSDLSVTLTNSSGKIYNSETCTTEAISTAVAKGGSSAVVWFTSNSATLNHTLDAEATGYDPVATVLLGFQKDAVVPKPKLGRLDESKPLNTNSCIAITLWQGQATGSSYTTSKTSIENTVSATKGTLYSDGACTTEIKKATWVIGSALEVFWFRSKSSGKSTISGTSSIGEATLDLAVE